MRGRVGLGWAVALLLAVAGCEKSAPEPAMENATPSPNASILPAPLASVAQPAAEGPGWTPSGAHSGASAELGQKVSFGDAGSSPPPEVLRAGQPLDDDTLAQREVVGVSLQGEWRYADLPPAPKEGNSAGLDAARKSTALKMQIDLAALGRMRVVFQSRALAVEAGTEVRARVDRYGHVLVWPNGSAYRVLPLGAVRTLLGEGRADANPLVRAQSSTVSDGPRRAARRTKRWELATRTGKLALDQARMLAAGEGGPLFCRFLAELIAIDPSAAPCAVDDVPLRAQYTWPEGGSIVFEVLDVVDKTELSAAQLMVPPAGAEFARTGLPARSSALLLTREELGALRLRPSETLPAGDEGPTLRNASEILRYTYIDGVPAALVPPNRDVTLSGLTRGRYGVQWRTFFADAVDPPAFVDVPARPSAPPAEARDR
jgi:hypothetical protein